MVPAAIGSERRRHMPTPTPIGSMSMGGNNDWSSVSKRKIYLQYLLMPIFSSRLEPYAIDPYLQKQQQQQQVPLSSEYQQQSTRDYTR